jgi:hypothetical protein
VSKRISVEQAATASRSSWPWEAGTLLETVPDAADGGAEGSCCGVPGVKVRAI